MKALDNIIEISKQLELSFVLDQANEVKEVYDILIQIKEVDHRLIEALQIRIHEGDERIKDLEYQLTEKKRIIEEIINVNHHLN